MPAPAEPLRRLPVPVRLIARETIGSFLTRLAFANSLHVPHLLTLAAITTDQRSFTPATDDTRGWNESTPARIAALASRPLPDLAAAIPLLATLTPAGTRGRQIAGRFGVITCQAFAYGTAAQRQEWHALIATLEQSLRLHRHAPGQLLKLAGYLHERTDGMIGSLSHLIRGAVVEAILDGSEKITRETLAVSASTRPPRPPRHAARTRAT